MVRAHKRERLTMDKITELKAIADETTATKKKAHKDFKTAKAKYKKTVKSAETDFIKADRARAQAIHADRLAKKAHRNEQDRIKIEQSSKKAVK